jgi:hypothetical protein
VLNDPINFIDPRGTNLAGPILGATIIVVGVVVGIYVIYSLLPEIQNFIQNNIQAPALPDPPAPRANTSDSCPLNQGSVF